MASAIRLESAHPNDFATFFDTHPRIRTIGFNGRKAQQMFTRLVRDGPPAADQVLLPSTSPAYASLAFSAKLSAWRDALDIEQ